MKAIINIELSSAPYAPEGSHQVEVEFEPSGTGPPHEQALRAAATKLSGERRAKLKRGARPTQRRKPATATAAQRRGKS